MTARERLIHLLAHYREAPLAHAGQEGQGLTGPRLSQMWADSSYPELDRWLRQMRYCACPGRKHRGSCMRHTYWHLRELYIDRQRQTLEVPVRYGKLVLPKGASLASSQSLSLLPEGASTIRVAVLRSNPRARRNEAEKGLQWLLRRMHDGDSSRITLPVVLRDFAVA